MKISMIPEKITSAYLFLMFTLFLLCLGSEGYGNIFEAKTTVFTVLNILYIALMLVSQVVLRLKKQAVSNVRLETVHVFVLLYMAISLLSALVSEHFPHTLLGANRYEGAFTICIYGTVFILVSMFGTLTKRLYISLAAAVTAFDAVCILQLLGFNPLYLYPKGMTFYDAGRLYAGSYIGLSGNAGFSAAILCLFIPLFAIMLIKRGGCHPVVSAVPLVLSLAVAVFMNIDAAVVGIVGAAVIAVPAVMELDRKARRIFWCAVLVLAAAFVIVVRCFDIGRGTLHELHMILSGSLLDKYGSGRIGIWRKVLCVIGEAPILGKGPDTMMLEGFEPFSRYYPELGRTLTAPIDNAHNEYLNILYHQGILGLAAYTGILVSAAVELAGRCRKDKTVFALSVGVLAYLIQAFFGIGICISSAYFWIFLAIACKGAHDVGDEKLL